MACLLGKLETVPDVEIDTGVFKYILIKVHAEKTHKFIVRGFKRAGFHADIYDEVSPGIEGGLDLDCECMGGGRINHDASKKTISVYGHSIGFGRAKHEITTEVLKKEYPDYTSITWSNEGY